MTALASPTLTMNDGREIPQLGFGVFTMSNEEAEASVKEALTVGYRHIDTAAVYGNEEGVRRGIEASGVDPSEIFLVTKLWNTDQGYDSTLRAFEESMQRLGRESIDLYLIHWSMPKRRLYPETWRAFLELKEQGRISSVGVANFPVEQLEDLVDGSGVAPVLNQIELHPHFNQPELRRVNAEMGVLTESWGPLSQGGDALTDPVITEIAKAHGATPAQTILAWHRQLGLVVIPKSVTPERIRENFKSLQLTLTDDEVERITALDRGPEGRVSRDPADFNE